MLQFQRTWSKYITVLCLIEQRYVIAICRSIEDKCAALDSLNSHQSPQATSANSGQSKWTTQEEIHSNETAGADSGKESLLWSKFTVITSPLSQDTDSFFRNVGKSWAQQKLNVVLSFPSRLAALVEWDWNRECLLWWFENLYRNSPQRGETFCVCSTQKLNNHWENSFWFTADAQLSSILVFPPCTMFLWLWIHGKNSHRGVVGRDRSTSVLWLWLLGAG